MPRKKAKLPPGTEAGKQDGGYGPNVRTPREVPDARPEGMDTVVPVVADDLSSKWNEQVEQIGCNKTRSARKVTPQELSTVLMDVAFTGKTVAALYETLVEQRPYQWVAERHGLKPESFKVARSRVLAQIIAEFG